MSHKRWFIFPNTPLQTGVCKGVDYTRNKKFLTLPASISFPLKFWAFICYIYFDIIIIITKPRRKVGIPTESVGIYKK